MKLGIFGGSFDPVHFGHLVLAERAREAAGLDKVLFIPAATSPLKPGGPVATDRQRTEMTQLAIGGNEAFQLSDIELKRDGVSYTVDTLETLSVEHPGDELFLILGSDSLADLGQWKSPQQICQQAIPLVAARRGTSPDLNQLSEFVAAERLKQIEKYQFEFPWIEISSTELRRRIADGKSIRYRTPRSVECYIHNAEIYRDESAN